MHNSTAAGGMMCTTAQLHRHSRHDAQTEEAFFKLIRSSSSSSHETTSSAAGGPICSSADDSGDNDGLGYGGGSIGGNCDGQHWHVWW